MVFEMGRTPMLRRIFEMDREYRRFLTEESKGHAKITKHYLWGFNTHRFDEMFILGELLRCFPDVTLLGSLTKVRKL